MTDDHHLDDEALSAVLDGEAAPEEAAHAEVCATCGVRLSDLRDASLLVGAPVPPPDPARREATIAAALDAEPAATSTVTSLRRRLPPAWLAAAAAVIVAVAAVALLPRGEDDSKQTAASSGAGATTTASESATPDASANSFDATVASPADGGDLGDVASVDLEQSVRDALDRPQVAADLAAPSGGAAAGRTEAITCDDPELGALVFHAIGTLDGTPVTVLAYDDGTGNRTVYVVENEGCVIRDRQTFAA